MSSAPPAAADIMDALLREADDTPYPGQQALERLIRRAASPGPAPRAVPSPAPKPAPVADAPHRATLRPVPPKAKGHAKRKATHYFEVTAAARLDAARADLAAMAADAPRTGRRISKSAILETALILACDAFEAAGQNSPLARRLLSCVESAAPKSGA